MSEQMTWVPTPKAKPRMVKVADAMGRVNRLANWYETNKPSVSRIFVTKEDYKSFEEAVNTNGISLDKDGLRYRRYLIVVAP